MKRVNEAKVAASLSIFHTSGTVETIANNKHVRQKSLIKNFRRMQRAKNGEKCNLP